MEILNPGAKLAFCFIAAPVCCDKTVAFVQTSCSNLSAGSKVCHFEKFACCRGTKTFCRVTDLPSPSPPSSPALATVITESTSCFPSALLYVGLPLFPSASECEINLNHLATKPTCSCMCLTVSFTVDPPPVFKGRPHLAVILFYLTVTV